MEEESYAGGFGEVEGECVLFEETDGGEGWGGGVGGVGGDPVVEVGLGDVGEGRVEFDADDLAEGEFAGDEHGAAFAGTEVDEGVLLDGVGGIGDAPEVYEGAEDGGGDAVVGGDVVVVGVAGDEVAGGDEAAGVDSVSGVEGVDGRVDGVGFARESDGGHEGLADLDEAGVAVETEDATAGGGDLLRGPRSAVDEGDGGLADGFEAGEAVGDLGVELCFGVVRGAGQGEGDGDAMFLGDAGDVGAGGVEVGGDGEGAEEAEVDDVAGDDGVVAVAEGAEDFCFHGLSRG